MKDIFTLNQYDPFKELEQKQNQKIHLRIQKRTTRKSITIIENLKDQVPVTQFLKHIRKALGCNGCIKQDPETESPIVQVQGDQRAKIRQILQTKYRITENQIITHGF